MKKNGIFIYTAPNGVEVTAVVVSILRDDKDDKWYLCYAQNRLFEYRILSGMGHPLISTWVEYAIIPKYDELLAHLGNNNI